MPVVVRFRPFLTICCTALLRCRARTEACCTTGTIIPRKRQTGTIGYTAQIRIKRKGKVIHHEAKTFDRKQAAAAWIEKRESELREPGALDRTKAADVTLAEAIDRYIRESRKAIGRTTAQVLRAIKGYSIANMQCSEITSTDIVAFAQELSADRKPHQYPGIARGNRRSATHTFVKPAISMKAGNG